MFCSVLGCRHLAPEYFMHGVVDEKTDVFAFGVFLLELLSGKKPVDGSYQSLHSWVKETKKKKKMKSFLWIIDVWLMMNNKNLIFRVLFSWLKQAKPILNRGEIEMVVDPRLEGSYDVKQLKTLAFAASLCIRASSIWRPTMSEVIFRQIWFDIYSKIMYLKANTINFHF